MALIECEECGKEISNHAKSCPNCGWENNFIFCPECDKRISKKANACPECGYSFNQEQYAIMNEKKSISVTSLTGMVLSIISFFIDILGIVSLTSLVLSIVGFCISKNQSSKSFAIIGMVCGCIEFAIKIASLLVIGGGL